jgi:hypothetical protein
MLKIEYPTPSAPACVCVCVFVAYLVEHYHHDQCRQGQNGAGGPNAENESLDASKEEGDSTRSHCGF